MLGADTWYSGLQTAWPQVGVLYTAGRSSKRGQFCEETWAGQEKVMLALLVKTRQGRMEAPAAPAYQDPRGAAFTEE